MRKEILIGAIAGTLSYSGMSFLNADSSVGLNTVVYSEQEPVAALEIMYPGIKEDIVKKISVGKGLSLFVLKTGQNIFYDHESGTVIHSLSRKGMASYSIENGVVYNSLEKARIPFHKDIIENELKEPIIYQSPNEMAVLRVFIEPFCGYCHKLHKEIDTYLANGFSIHYYPLPIYGEGSENIFNSIWSIEDKALRKAELDRVLKQIALRVPDAEYTLDALKLPIPQENGILTAKTNKMAGNKMAINATPALVLDDGMVLSGYIPALELKKLFINNQINN